MNKYKLIVFGDEWDVYKVAYRDWIENPKILYIPTFRPKGFLGMLQRIHLNPKLNAVVNLPWKWMWNKSILRSVGTGKTCFLILDRWLRMEGGIALLPYLRKHYPDAVIVCYAQDLLEKIEDLYSKRPVDVDYVKRYANLFVSYDKDDAARYGILYHPTVYSPVQKGNGTGDFHYDLFFLGRDKGRLDKLVNICKAAKERGLKCRFVMLGVPQKDRIECEGMEYENCSVPYMENLRCCAESRCVVELLQNQASSPTYRTWEAISLNRKLLTNQTVIKKEHVYDERYISVFHDVDDIDWNFVKKPIPFADTNPFQEKIRPEALIRFMERELKIEIER
jgi:hypothetical protein